MSRFLIFAALLLSAPVLACDIGTKVTLKGGSTGTLAEVGTESPHVGWYRITFSWSANGEWYDPKTWEVFAEGTTKRCLPGAAAGAPRSPPKTPAAPQPTRTETADCPMTQPPATNSKSASAQLFQRVIYEREAARINPGSKSAPKAIGLTFLEFKQGEAYENTLTSTRFGDKRLHTGAPEGAMIYPLETKELLCELHGSQVRRTVSLESRSCFIGKSNVWTCPGRTVKTIESRLIDLP